MIVSEVVVVVVIINSDDDCYDYDIIAFTWSAARWRWRNSASTVNDRVVDFNDVNDIIIVIIVVSSKVITFSTLSMGHKVIIALNNFLCCQSLYCYSYCYCWSPRPNNSTHRHPAEQYSIVIYVIYVIYVIDAIDAIYCYSTTTKPTIFLLPIVIFVMCSSLFLFV